MPSLIARRRERAHWARPIRVAQVCATTDGALWMVQIGAGLTARGYEVVAIIGSSDGGTAGALRKAGIPFEVEPLYLASRGRVATRLRRIPRTLALRAILDAGAMLRRAGRLARILRRREIDVVHGHTFSSMLVARMAGAMARVPLRVSMPAGPYHLEVPLFRRIDLATHRLDHVVMPGCQRTDELYAENGVTPSRRRVVGYGVDPSTFDPAEHARREVAARLVCVRRAARMNVVDAQANGRLVPRGEPVPSRDWRGRDHPEGRMTAAVRRRRSGRMRRPSSRR